MTLRFNSEKIVPRLNIFWQSFHLQHIRKSKLLAVFTLQYLVEIVLHKRKLFHTINSP